MDQKMVTSDHCLRNQRMTHPWGHCLHLGRETGHRVPSRRSESLRTLDHRFFDTERNAGELAIIYELIFEIHRITCQFHPIFNLQLSDDDITTHVPVLQISLYPPWSAHPLILDLACYIQVRIQHQKVDVGSTSRIVQHANAFDQTCHPRGNQQVKRKPNRNSTGYQTLTLPCTSKPSMDWNSPEKCTSRAFSLKCQNYWRSLR